MKCESEKLSKEKSDREKEVCIIISVLRFSLYFFYLGRNIISQIY